MDTRLLLLGALLACNALYLIWKAKGSPAIRPDLTSLRRRLDRFLPILTSITPSQTDLQRTATDKASGGLLVQSNSENLGSKGVPGLEDQPTAEARHPQDQSNHIRLSEQISLTTRAQISKGLSAYLLSILSNSEGNSLVQSIQVDLTDLPHSGATPPQSSDIDRAEVQLGETARLVLDLQELEVDLTARPADPWVNETSDLISIQEWMEGAEGLSVLPAVSREVPAVLLPLLGLIDSVSESQNQNEKHLARLLAVLKPSRVRLLDTPPIRSLEAGDTNDQKTFCSPLLPLVYTGRMPLAIAGNSYFTQPSQILNYLEIGPWIPVSDRCETEYSFVFSRWRIRVLAIRTKWPEKKGMLKRTSKCPLPGILWDQSMGFCAMMAGTNSQDELNTRVVLIMEKVKHADKFAEEIEKLAKKEMDVEDKAQAKDAKSRLKSLKKMMYFVCPEAGRDVQRIFPGSKDKRQPGKTTDERHRGKGNQWEGEREFELPPLDPGPAKAQQALETETSNDR